MTSGVYTRKPGAYPRSRGGTGGDVHAATFTRGLSPLARGNRWTFRPMTVELGPIPARAGEPHKHRNVMRFNTAYPRSRGGT